MGSRLHGVTIIMAQDRTYDFSAPRTTQLLNNKSKFVAPTDLYKGFNVVIDTGTVGAADTIKIVNAPDTTSVLQTKEGVRIEETGPDPVASTLGIATADGSNPRIDIVVLQHTFSISNNPATYAVVTGTPAASPTVPATPSDGIVLAEVFVATSAASITNGNIIRRKKAFTGIDDEDSRRVNTLEDGLHPAVADITALAGIDPESRSDNQVVLVKDDGTGVAILYRFDSASTATADALRVVSPSVFALGTAGRWLRMPVADGVFVAKIGGSTPDYAGTAIRAAFSDFENSGREAALFIVRENMDFSGGNLTVRKPIKMVGQVEPGGSHYDFSFDGSDVLTFAPEATVDPGYIEAEFIGININRGASGTGGISFTLNSSLRLRFSRIEDLATGPTVDFIGFADSAGTVDLEASVLIPASNQNLISGLNSIVCRRCNITDATGKAFDTAALDLYLIESTTFVADDFTDVTTLRVWLDGTSILAGSTQFPAGFTNLDVAGNDFWAPRFGPIGGISFSEALNFNISGNIVLGNSVISLGSSAQTISRSDLVVTGTKAGSAGTRIEGAPSAVGNNMIALTGDRVSFQGIVFRCSPSVASHTGNIIIASNRVGIKVEDCELQAEGSNDTGIAVNLGGATATAVDRNLIRNCWVRSSPDGTPAEFRVIGLVSNGSGLIENCMVENFLETGVSSISSNNPVNTGGRISNCVIDMSSCTSTVSKGLIAEGILVSNCRVRCPGLATDLDLAIAISVSNAGNTATGEGAVVSNCQLSGEGTSSNRRIGIGMFIPSTSDQCNINGCTIKDFRIHGIKIEGDLNIVVHNIITSIDDGAAGGIAIETLSGAINNLVDVNLETATGGTPFVNNGGATNFFDTTATTDNTGNKSV